MTQWSSWWSTNFSTCVTASLHSFSTAFSPSVARPRSSKMRGQRAAKPRAVCEPALGTSQNTRCFTSARGRGVTMHVVVAGAVELSSDEEAARLLSTGQAQLHPSSAPPGAYSPTPNNPERHFFHSPHGCSQPNPESPRPSEIRPRIARAGETFGELVVLDLAASYAATAVACEPTALYMIEQATLYDRFASMPEVLNKMRQRAAQTHKDGVYSKLPESGEEAPQVRAKNMRSSLVGGGGATLPTGFADTMLTLLSDVQRRLATIDHRLDAMERRIDGDDAEAPVPASPQTPRAPTLQPSSSTPTTPRWTAPAARTAAALTRSASFQTHQAKLYQKDTVRLT